MATGELADHRHPGLRAGAHRGASRRAAGGRPPPDGPGHRPGRSGRPYVPCPAPRPGFALAATAGSVPLRVAARLGQPARTRRPGAPRRPAALTLLAWLVVSAGASFPAADDLHTGIEIAQGETGAE
ncbi:hypothetical protein ACFCYH_05470 [Streptomyces sp. NPDC056400]|uniref:hypothetical protein n=1 Tax=Streptomyces sp. NPDC056400 TaxID=3345808 RepID=UPI0035D6B4B2